MKEIVILIGVICFIIGFFISNTILMGLGPILIVISLYHIGGEVEDGNNKRVGRSKV